jgi:hypothetical protein
MNRTQSYVSRAQSHVHRAHVHVSRAQSHVILSGTSASRSEALAESKDPAFACTLHRRVKFSARILLATLLCVILASLASAQTLTGKVMNATTGKLSAGDEVILLSLGQGMEESGRTKSDAKGNFSFKLDNAQSPHLVRVIHQEVTYHRMAPPGSTSVEVEIYDVSKKVEGIQVVADIMRFQAGQGQMQIERSFSVQNSSRPPLTQMNEHNLEFYVPQGATIVGGQAMTANGQPVNSAPVPEDAGKTRYSFLFPLRPGESRFSVVYTLPYTGSVNIDPKSIYPLEHFVVMSPKSMQFSAASPANYASTPFPGQPDADVEVASNMKVADKLAFKISGEGVFQEQAEQGAQSGGQGGSPQAENRPGGGLGPPIDAPDPLRQYRWYILGGFAAVLIIGGVFVASRQQSANRARSTLAGAVSEEEFATAPFASQAGARAVAAAPSPASTASKLLEGLKEELFELEVEHKQGRISQEEYEKTKAALDQTLQRALKRSS